MKAYFISSLLTLTNVIFLFDVEVKGNTSRFRSGNTSRFRSAIQVLPSDLANWKILLFSLLTFLLDVN